MLCLNTTRYFTNKAKPATAKIAKITKPAIAPPDGTLRNLPFVADPANAALFGPWDVDTLLVGSTALLGSAAGLSSCDPLIEVSLLVGDVVTNCSIPIRTDSLDVGKAVKIPKGSTELSTKSGLNVPIVSFVLIIVVGPGLVLNGLDRDGREKDRLMGNDNDARRFVLLSIAKSSRIMAWAASPLSIDMSCGFLGDC